VQRVEERVERDGGAVVEQDDGALADAHDDDLLVGDVGEIDLDRLVVAELDRDRLVVGRLRQLDDLDLLRARLCSDLRDLDGRVHRRLR